RAEQGDRKRRRVVQGGSKIPEQRVSGDHTAQNEARLESENAVHCQQVRIQRKGKQTTREGQNKAYDNRGEREESRYSKIRESLVPKGRTRQHHQARCTQEPGEADQPRSKIRVKREECPISQAKRQAEDKGRNDFAPRRPRRQKDHE